MYNKFTTSDMMMGEEGDMDGDDDDDYDPNRERKSLVWLFTKN